MNGIVLKNLFFYFFIFLIKKTTFEIKFLIRNIFNQFFYREKIDSFEKFIKENHRYWNKKKIYNSKKKILISNFISTPGDTMTNCIIGKYLEEKYKMSLFTIKDIENNTELILNKGQNY